MCEKNKHSQSKNISSNALSAYEVQLTVRETSPFPFYLSANKYIFSEFRIYLVKIQN